jgi:hypothetical protein
MNKLLGCLCVFCSVFFLSSISGASLIQNGDFETQALDYWDKLGSVNVKKADVSETSWGMDNFFASLGAEENVGFSSLSQDFEATGLSEVVISFDWFFGFVDLSQMGNDEFAAIVKEDKVLYSMPIDLLLEQSYQTLGHVAFGTFKEVVDISSWSLDEGRLTFVLTERLLDPLSDSRAGVDNVSVAPVPEPATVLLIGSGLLGLAGYRKRFQRK